MKIEAVDFFYLSMPVIQDIGDGSQDALLVRVVGGGYVGWGECEASPLASIAALICPMSHSACKPVLSSVLGQTVDTPEDIERIGRLVHENSMDLLQADHTLSGIDIALWDLLGKRYEQPIYRLLNFPKSFPKTPYASRLFGDTAAETLDQARTLRAKGFHAIKFGWGPFGRGTAQDDIDQIVAAREGMGNDALLLIDAGTVWGDSVDKALQRLEALQEAKVSWLEEPFHTGAFDAYRALATRAGHVKLAAGEGSHNEYMARHLIDYANIGYIQIDTGRIGGITPASKVAAYAEGRGITYVNHTFTSHLALSASLQPYAGLADHTLCEYPVALQPLAAVLSLESLALDSNGQISVPDRPGLGITPDLEALRPYLVEAEIIVKGKQLYRTPPL